MKNIQKQPVSPDSSTLSPEKSTPSPEISAAFPAPWAEILPPETVETALELAESVYALQSHSHKVSAKTFTSDSPSVSPSDSLPVFPTRRHVFRALSLTPPEAVRAVILGQDPYPTAGHAHGLAFSVPPGVSPLPPSLRNIFKEYAACFGLPVPYFDTISDKSSVPFSPSGSRSSVPSRPSGFHVPPSGDLTPWAERGVLLLNAVLTVEQGRPGSHRRRGWQSVTDAVLRACLRLPLPCAFLLWGRDAQSAFQRAADGLQLCVKHKSFTVNDSSSIGPDLCDNIQASSNALQIFRFPYETAGEGKYVLRSSHPSPLGAAKPCGDSPPFLGSRPFARANALLGRRAIDWRLN